MGRRRAALLALALVTLFVTLAASRAAGPPAAAPAPYRARPSTYHLPPDLAADSTRAWNWISEQKMDSAFALVRSAIARTRRSGDRFALNRFVFIEGAAYCVLQDGKSALPRLDEAVELATANAETLALLPCLRQRAYAYGLMGRLDDQAREAGHLLEAAEAAGNPLQQAVAHNFLGWNAQQRGRYADAVRHLATAGTLNRQVGNAREELFCLVSLGGIQLELGEYDAARSTYLRCLGLARETKLGWPETQALQALGAIEGTVGDPARAAGYHAAAYRSHLAHGQIVDAVLALQGLADAQIALGRGDLAARFAREGLALCDRAGTTLLRGELLAQLARAEEAGGRPAAAAADYRRLLALGDSVGANPRVRAALGLARHLERPDSVAAQRELLRWAHTTLADRASLVDRLELELAWARRRRADGAANEADAIARTTASTAAAHGLHEYEIEAWHEVARANRTLERPDSAARAFERATAAWETWRRRPSDPEWREQRGGSVRSLATDYASLLLVWPPAASEAARTAAAFDLLQRTKTRTLLERMAGPRALAPDSGLTARAALGLADVQSRVLAPGELLLEAYTGPDTSLVFAITRDTCLVLGLPGETTLLGAAEIVHELLRSPIAKASDREAANAAARSLARDWFGGASALLAGAGTVFVAPDGPLYLVPFAALPSGPEAGAPAWVERARIVTVPSATLLGRLREHEQREGRGVLALAGAGPRLAGARSELGWLQGEYRDVTVRTPADSSPPTPATLRPYAAIHFAGHTVLDDRFPWRSGLAVRATRPAPDTLGIESILADSGAAAEPLRAEAIAAQPIAASLVVLSSCETASGRIVSGEGIAGLSSAFLAAGAPAVVATLWPVEDATTARLVRDFYRGLARGWTAAEALQSAQRRLMRERATADPIYWAGFVLVGDGNTRLRLEANPFSPERLALYLLAGLGLAALLAATWARRRGRL